MITVLYDSESKSYGFKERSMQQFLRENPMRQIISRNENYGLPTHFIAIESKIYGITTNRPPSIPNSESPYKLP